MNVIKNEKSILIQTKGILLFVSAFIFLGASAECIAKAKRPFSVENYRHNQILKLAQGFDFKAIGQSRWNRSAKLLIVMGKKDSKPLSVVLRRGTGDSKLDKKLIDAFHSFDKFDKLPKNFPAKDLAFTVDLLPDPVTPKARKTSDSSTGADH